MKLDKLLLSMQTVTLLPLIFFVLIYAHNTLAYIGLAIVLLFVLGVNFYRYTKSLRIFRYPLLGMLIGSFLVYALLGLGSRESPQNFEVMHHKASPLATFDFEKPTAIDKVCYYVGIDKNVNFTLEYLERKEWKTYHEYKKNFPFSFRWKCIDKNVTTSKIRLRITKNQMMLNEVRFMSKDKTIPFSTNKKYLNDEQEMAIDTSYFGGMFFDEIYHSRTAYELIHDIPVYETTHPYLGKLLIVPGIELFGMTPFGWRFTNVLFAALLIFMAYYFALQLFKKRLFAFLAAFVMTYSFMHLTQARIGLIDTFGVLFVFISYYFLYRFILKQKLSLLLLSGLFFGLASAVKWSAVFAALGFVFIALYLLITRYPLEKRFSGYRLILYGVLSYVGVSVSVYALSFFDIYLQTGSFQKIIEYQYNMFNYHSAVVSEHPYGSPWWSWPMDWKPMCYYREIQDKLFSSITAFGNPAIFWLGIVSIFYLFCVVCKRATLEASFILFSFLGLYLPYIFIGRQMFIYHFYYAVPFMMLGIVYMLKDMMKSSPKYRKLYVLYLAIIAGLFLAFYPVLSGYEVPKIYVDSALIWFPWWWL
ncbi:MAG: glycosyltransferase family 39 protein [Sulfurovum sp.]|nr:glycosyltransferase family 39 protein [Sulfurovum sp.]